MDASAGLVPRRSQGPFHAVCQRGEAPEGLNAVTESFP